MLNCLTDFEQKIYVNKIMIKNFANNDTVVTHCFTQQCGANQGSCCHAFSRAHLGMLQN